MNNHCRRCSKELASIDDLSTRFCNECFYPGIEETYDEYQALLDEGHRRIQAAVMSGWQDPDEAGGAY
ncbi:hypothetical protein [Vibrio mediterranei]|uniref:Zinc ribbon domain-containing protein n=1 Tax=Vibrio mediterranei TaxID=689 RepID=A0ABX5DD00_9VIBR|nr:hypothetical protein [Vibrio mediterranei]PCD85617.1 hypothetical protein COR52_25645 [Vibrio mediterranei]PRQ66496.1 hypothetical protein COR51_16300 [Vibrio mediterranei]